MSDLCQGMSIVLGLIVAVFASILAWVALAWVVVTLWEIINRG